MLVNKQEIQKVSSVRQLIVVNQT